MVAKVNTDVNISIVSRNIGSDPQSVTYNLTLKDASGSVLHTLSQTAANLAVGGWYNYTFQLNYTTAGNYTVEVEANLTGDSNMTNNVRSAPYTLKTTLSKILLVDDDDNGTWESYYEEALWANAFIFDKHNISSNENPQLQQLEWYQIIVWFTGPDYRDTITEKDQENLSAYKNGSTVAVRRNLLITGQDIGYELTDDGGKSNYFYNDVLMADYISDAYQPAVGDAINVSNLGTLLSAGTSDLVNIYYPKVKHIYADQISPHGTAYAIANYGMNSADIAGIAYQTTDWRHIYLGFSFETINSSDLRNQWMYDMITWLGTGITGLQAQKDLSVSSVGCPTTGDTLHPVQINTTIKNTGTNIILTATYTLTLTIYYSNGSVAHTDSTTGTLTNFASNSTKDYNWTAWQPHAQDNYTVVVNVSMNGDEIPENNQGSAKISVIYLTERDLAITSVVVLDTPPIYVGSEADVNVTVRNAGNLTQDGTVYLNITYQSNTTVVFSAASAAVTGLDPNGTTNVSFSIQTASLAAGTYRLRAYVELNGDEKPSNNYYNNTMLTLTARPNPLSVSLTPSSAQEIEPGAGVEYTLNFTTTSTAIGDVAVSLNISSFDPFTCEVLLNGTTPISPVDTLYVPLGSNASVLIKLTSPASASANTAVNLSVAAAWSELGTNFNFSATRKVTVKAIYDYSVDKTEISLSGYTGEVVSFDFNITNLANGVPDSYNVTLNCPQGYINPTIDTGFVIPAGSTRIVNGSFQIPATATQSDQITVNIASRNNTTNGKTIIIHLTPITSRIEIDRNIPSFTVEAGQSFSVMFNITSWTPGTQVYNLTTNMLSAFNYAFSTGTQVSIPGRGGKVTVYLNGSVPANHPIGEETFNITVSGGGLSPATSNNVVITIVPAPVYSIELNVSESSKTIDNKSITSVEFQVQVKNAGNSEDRVGITLSVPPNWTYSAPAEIPSIPAGQEQTITVRITWPSDAPNNTYTITMTATSTGDPSKSVTKTLTVILQRDMTPPAPKIVVVSITPSANTTKVNTPVQFTITVKNNGTAPGTNVVVKLYVNGAEVANKTIASIGVGETKTESLQYTFAAKGNYNIQAGINNEPAVAATAVSLTVEEEATHTGGSNTGLIIGIIIGVLALLGIAGAVVYFVFMRKPKEKQPAEGVSEEQYPEEPLPEEGEAGEAPEGAPPEEGSAETGEQPPAGEEEAQPPAEEQPQQEETPPEEGEQAPEQAPTEPAEEEQQEQPPADEEKPPEA